MKTIWKITLAPDNVFQVPVGAEILSVHAQRDEICLWMKVDPDAPREPRRFTAYATGGEVPDGPMTFLGSVYMHGGSLVFHVFEQKGSPCRG